MEKLDGNGHLNDFMNTLRNSKSGALEMDNIVFLLMMDWVRFQSVSNTIGMHYPDQTKLFWTIVYKLCKGTGLKFFSRSKNCGQVVYKKSEKSQYSPHISRRYILQFQMKKYSEITDMNCRKLFHLAKFTNH